MLLDEIRNIKSSKRDLRNFGLTIGIVLIILGVALLYAGKETSPYFLISGGAFILLGFAAPFILKPLQVPWMALAAALNWFMTRLILSVMFFFVLTPIGLVARLVGKQFLELKWDKTQSSYWHYRKAEESDKSNYERQF